MLKWWEGLTIFGTMVVIYALVPWENLETVFLRVLFFACLANISFGVLAIGEVIYEKVTKKEIPD